jgi:hypothetical protein
LELIGYPFEQARSDAGALCFTYRGSFGGLVQAAAVALLAVPAYFVDATLAWLVAATAIVLASGFVFTGLGAWDLSLDLEKREYELQRGIRNRRRRIAGSFCDFERVRIEPGWYSGLCVYLVPRGSERGYELYRELDEAAARAKAGTLAQALGIPVDDEPTPQKWQPGDVDLRFPPAGVPVKVSADGAGLRIELPPHSGLWRCWLKVDPQGIEAGLDLVVPWKGRQPSSTRAAWKQVTQVIVSNVLSGEERSSSRIRRDWRSNMRELWLQHCAETKQPPHPLPWWGGLWYLYEGRTREYEKGVCVYRTSGACLAIGSNWRLGDAGLLWLCSGIVTYGRRQGARFTTRS